MDGLTVGRMVHYVRTNGVHNAAIVSNVLNKTQGTVALTVFQLDHNNPVILINNVMFSDIKEPGTWHWIEQA